MRAATWWRPSALLLVLALTISETHAQSNGDAIARFESLVRDRLLRGHIPGATTTVVLGERIQYENALGVADLDAQRPMTLETLFRVSGLSKMTTAATLAALAIDGKLRLDAPIGEQWTAVPAFLSRMTLRQLTQDRAGLRDEHVDFSIGDRDALRQYVLGWDERYVIAEPGRFRSHSSAGANLAAAVAEQVTGVAFADLLDANLLRPLGMHLTTLRVLEAMTHPFTQGYSLNEGHPEVVRPFARNWIGWPSSSVFTSASEGAILLAALVNDGRWGGRQILSERLVRETLGLLEQESDGSFVGGHTWFDGRSDFAMVPKRHFAILHLENADEIRAGEETPRAGLVAAARAAWLGEAVPARAGSTSSEISFSEAQRLAGDYWNEHTLRLEVRAGKLYYMDEGTWYLERSDWFPVQKVGTNSYVTGRTDSSKTAAITVERSPTNPQFKPSRAAFVAIDDTNGNVSYLRVGSRVFRRQPSGDAHRP
jgi:CubicO group peptidase (beta-lactamase class C family)